MRGRVQNKDMASPNRHLNTRDEKNPPFLGIEGKILIKRHPVMVGDGNDIKTLVGGF
jgi:hypothetical protein